MSKIKSVIQVGGTVRSGTTILSLILANADNTISLGEVKHLFFPYRKVHFNKIKELTTDPVWNIIINDKPENLYDNIFKSFPKIDLIIDSSKDPVWFKKVSKKMNHNTLQLVTFKSPNDLKNSFVKRKMNNWKKVYLNYYKRFFTIFPLVSTVSLKKLLNDEVYLKELCEFLNISYSVNRLNYWEKNHPNFFGSETVRQKKIDSKILNDKEIEITVDNEMYLLFQKLKQKQFTFSPVDVLYKYPSFILKMLNFKDNVMQFINKEK